MFFLLKSNLIDSVDLQLNIQGHSAREIAIIVKKHHYSVSKELKHNKGPKCKAETAQYLYECRRKNCKSNGKFSVDLSEKILEKLKATWSPEQISNTVLKVIVSFKTIYNWVYQSKIETCNEKSLRQKGKRRRSCETRGEFVVGNLISQRPKEVKNRKTFDHWELDTMVSSRGQSKGCFATFVERKSRFCTAIKITNITTDR